ncbi:cytochrome b [Pelomonas sp. SE-A7]|uniref:cytochrome b n=1 Tax=Pelomonas sp. SE-A7 TaxID=3054953 RepID=UPI00259C72BF|nr:cytochrome b [Pelomonas sp. SE-A7]MDM4768087.1 cytochrome b [Pelomonas sp. SE-A7]
MPQPATIAPEQRYSLPAMVLHWLLALAIVGAFGVGLYMTGLPFSPARLKLYNWHKWAGVSILLLSGLRLLWRLYRQPPADLVMPEWQARAAHWTHGLLYALFFAVPLAGWAYSSAAGFPVVWFGLVPLPDLVSPDKALADSLKLAHKLLAYGLGLLVLAHLGAALKHHFVDRDGLLQRMLPAFR